MYYPILPSPVKFKHKLLYVGNDLNMMNSLRAALKAEGWFIVRCPGDSTVHALLQSHIHYDLLLFDENLPNTTGTQLARLTRRLQQRKHTPIILISCKECEVKKPRGNTHRFLWQPERLDELADTIRGMLPTR